MIGHVLEAIALYVFGLVVGVLLVLGIQALSGPLAGILG